MEKSMKVVEIREIEVSPDGVVNEILFDKAVKKNFIKYLAKKGKILYHHPPFFNVDFHGAYKIKGVEGERATKVIFKNNTKEAIDDFMQLIDLYKN
jgi:hypothetical protein